MAHSQFSSMCSPYCFCCKLTTESTSLMGLRFSPFGKVEVVVGLSSDGTSVWFSLFFVVSSISHSMPKFIRLLGGCNMGNIPTLSFHFISWNNFIRRILHSSTLLAEYSGYSSYRKAWFFHFPSSQDNVWLAGILRRPTSFFAFWFFTIIANSWI